MSQALLLLLASKSDFVQGMIDAGKIPSAPQLATFLQATLLRCTAL